MRADLLKMYNALDELDERVNYHSHMRPVTVVEEIPTKQLFILDGPEELDNGEFMSQLELGGEELGFMVARETDGVMYFGSSETRGLLPEEEVRKKKSIKKYRCGECQKLEIIPGNWYKYCEENQCKLALQKSGELPPSTVVQSGDYIMNTYQNTATEQTQQPDQMTVAQKVMPLVVDFGTSLAIAILSGLAIGAIRQRFLTRQPSFGARLWNNVAKPVLGGAVGAGLVMGATQLSNSGEAPISGE